MGQEEQKIADLKKVTEPREHKVSGSLGVYDAYKFIRKNKWLDIGQPLTEHQFYTIVREINKYYADQLIHNRDVKLPCRMGSLELRKRIPKIDIENGKLVTNLPIDWDSTLRLWIEDEQSKEDKVLIRQEAKEVFRVYYNKANAQYNNKSFYQFDLNRDIKKALKQRIKNNKIDAYIL